MNYTKALDMAQAALAEQLKVGQDTVSRLERRIDMLLSTLDDYVQALGGRLELNVKFPGHNMPTPAVPRRSPIEPGQ